MAALLKHAPSTLKSWHRCHQDHTAMEKGNEGDEIIFLSLRQIECNIPAEVVKVGQIGADLLVEIIVRSLLLITDGDAKVQKLQL
jgi:hypothetical protein